MLVNSGASGHQFDDALIPGSRYKLVNYQVLDAMQKITTSEGHRLDGVVRQLLRSDVIDANSTQHLV